MASSTVSQALLERKLAASEGIKDADDFHRKYARQLEEIYQRLLDELDLSELPCGPSICEAPGPRADKDVLKEFVRYIYDFTVPGAGDDDDETYDEDAEEESETIDEEEVADSEEAQPGAEADEEDEEEEPEDDEE